MFQTRYTFGTWVPGTLETVRPTVETALRAEGFGVLTEIDVAATLRAKLGVERDPYVILGACNPPLAHRALEADPSVGALLPCNVVLRADAGGTIVEAMDPAAALGLVETAGVAEVAGDARARLERAVAAVAVELGVDVAGPVAATAGPVTDDETDQADDAAETRGISAAGFVR
jgi:uncharacterized protein (DUF302 family)